MTSRRSILRLLGLAPVAGPIAARAAADTEIARLAGIATNVAPTTAFTGGAGPPAQSGGYRQARIAAANYAKAFGLPDFVRESIRRNSTFVGALDPDLAAMRSWSMSVKILTQRERNYQRQLELLEHSAWHERASAAFQKLTGWEWPW